MMDVRHQLSLAVEPHPRCAHEDALLAGSVKIAGDLYCPVDLNSGDTVTVTVANADGAVIAQGQCTAIYPQFREIEDKGTVIGTERVNRVKVK